LGESIKKDLVENYGVNPEKIFVYKYKVSAMFNPNIPKSLKPILNPNGPIVLTVCRISPEKGLQYLIEASRTIAEKVPNVRVVIKGDTAGKRYEEQLRKLIHEYNLHENVAIMKGSPHSEIPEYMSAADVFVLPSISEGLPLVMLEALATGVPVIASRVGGIPDVLINEYNGLLVEARDVEGLAKAVLRILFDDKLRKRIIEGSLKTTRHMQENDFEDLLSKSIFTVER
jgi:glycosyltransferase involved in cell wall biosynthesis